MAEYQNKQADAVTATSGNMIGQADKLGNKWKQPNPTSGVPADARKMLGDRYAQQYGENMMDWPMSAVNNLRADTKAIQNRTREEGYNRQGFNNVMQRSPWVAQQMGSMPADANAQQLHDAAIRAEHYGMTQAGAAQANAYQQKQMRDAAMMRQAQMQNYWATMQREQAARSRQQQQMASQQMPVYNPGVEAARAAKMQEIYGNNQNTQQPTAAPTTSAQTVPQQAPVQYNTPMTRFLFPGMIQAGSTPRTGDIVTPNPAYDQAAGGNITVNRKPGGHYDANGQLIREERPAVTVQIPGIAGVKNTPTSAENIRKQNEGYEAWRKDNPISSAYEDFEQQTRMRPDENNPGQMRPATVQEMQEDFNAFDTRMREQYGDNWLIDSLNENAGPGRPVTDTVVNTSAPSEDAFYQNMRAKHIPEYVNNRNDILTRWENFAAENGGIDPTTPEFTQKFGDFWNEMAAAHPEYADENPTEYRDRFLHDYLVNELNDRLAAISDSEDGMTYDKMYNLAAELGDKYNAGDAGGFWDSKADAGYWEAMRENYPELFADSYNPAQPTATAPDESQIATHPINGIDGIVVTSDKKPVYNDKGEQVGWQDKDGNTVNAPLPNSPQAGAAGSGAVNPTGAGNTGSTNTGANGANGGGGEPPPVPGMSEWFNSNLRPIGSIAAALLTGGLISMLGGDNKKNSALLTLLMLLGGGAAGMFAWNALGPEEQQTT